MKTMIFFLFAFLALVYGAEEHWMLRMARETTERKINELEHWNGPTLREQEAEGRAEAEKFAERYSGWPVKLQRVPFDGKLGESAVEQRIGEVLDNFPRGARIVASYSVGGENPLGARGLATRDFRTERVTVTLWEQSSAVWHHEFTHGYTLPYQTLDAARALVEGFTEMVAWVCRPQDMELQLEHVAKAVEITGDWKAFRKRVGWTIDMGQPTHAEYTLLSFLALQTFDMAGAEIDEKSPRNNAEFADLFLRTRTAEEFELKLNALLKKKGISLDVFWYKCYDNAVLWKQQYRNEVGSK